LRFEIYGIQYGLTIPISTAEVAPQSAPAAALISWLYNIYCLRAFDEPEPIKTLKSLGTKSMALMNQTTKQIPCEIISIEEGRTWNNVTVQRKSSKKRLFFGKARKDVDLNIGDTAYIEVEVMPSELPETPLRVTLYSEEGTKIDWTIIQPDVFNVV